MSLTELGLEEIRGLTFEALLRFANGKNRWGGGLQYGILIPEVEYLAATKGLISIPPGRDPEAAHITETEADNVREVISNLIVEGVLMFAISRSQPEPPFLSLTEYGKMVVRERRLIPHDPDGFLKTFSEDVPQASPLVLVYLREALQTYRHNTVLAASVMLGGAAEAAFYDLFYSLKSTLTNPDKQKQFERLEKDISIRKKHEEVLSNIELIKTVISDRPLKESLDTNLGGVFNIIRLQRNDAGHPTGNSITRDDVFVSFRLFVVYSSTLYN